MVQINHLITLENKRLKLFLKIKWHQAAVAIGGSIGSMFNPPRKLKIEEIKELVLKFANDAKISKEIGFSGVEIHYAH